MTVECSDLHRTSISNPSPKAQETSLEEEWGKKEPVDKEDCWEMLFSEHDMAIVLRNSQQLWSPTQDLHKVKSVSILA